MCFSKWGDIGWGENTFSKYFFSHFSFSCLKRKTLRKLRKKKIKKKKIFSRKILSFYFKTVFSFQSLRITHALEAYYTYQNFWPTLTICFHCLVWQRNQKCLLQSALMQRAVWGTMPGITCFTFPKNGGVCWFFPSFFLHFFSPERVEMG